MLFHPKLLLLTVLALSSDEIVDRDKILSPTPKVLTVTMLFMKQPWCKLYDIFTYQVFPSYHMGSNVSVECEFIYSIFNSRTEI